MITPRSIGTICRQLDGLPLAIELAAAQIKHVTPDDLQARLSHRLDTLIDGPRDLPGRLQTMRAAIDWSYSRLSPDEQHVFRCLSVFSGGLTTEAVAALLAPPESNEVSWPLPHCEKPVGLPRILTSLIDKSLLQPVPTRNERRFSTLETIREFAGEQLAACGDLKAIHGRHAAWFLALAEQVAASCHHSAEAETLLRLEPDQGNLPAAVAWLGGPHGNTEHAFRLINGLFWSWYTCGYYREAWDWSTDLLERPATWISPQHVLLATINACWLALHLGKPAQALELAADGSYPVSTPGPPLALRVCLRNTGIHDHGGRQQSPDSRSDAETGEGRSTRGR